MPIVAQICPVCDGKATVPAHFYPGDPASSASRQKCRSCVDGIVFPIAEAHMHHFTVSYNEGLEGLERAIMEAIEQLVKQNVNPKEIVIYMSPFVNHFIIQAVHDLPFRSAFQINMEKATISQYFAYPVLPGYEYGKVIVSYIQGERVNIPAISISFEVKRTKS